MVTINITTEGGILAERFEVENGDVQITRLVRDALEERNFWSCDGCDKWYRDSADCVEIGVNIYCPSCGEERQKKSSENSQE